MLPPLVFNLGEGMIRTMANLIFAMNLSLDGYVDHEAMAPSPALFRHWIENQRGLAGSIYGRRM
jgi:hypothetical protein